MLILDWMKRNVVSVAPDATLLHCRNLYKEHKINSLPVVDKDKHVIGLICASDIKAVAPQGGTGLEILEAIDVLNETQVAQVMIKSPVTVSYKFTLEQAAQLMIEKYVPRLPVVDDNNRLVGFLTAWDVFRGLVSISGGAMPKGVEMAFDLENKQGTLRAILDTLKEEGARVSTVLSSIDDDGRRQVKIRFWSDNKAAEDSALEKLKTHTGMRYWARGNEVFLRDTPNFA